MNAAKLQQRNVNKCFKYSKNHILLLFLLGETACFFLKHENFHSLHGAMQKWREGDEKDAAAFSPLLPPKKLFY